MDITLKQLEVFVKTAQKGNVSKAADSMHMTQSAASMALSEFEKILGEKVFDRKGKRLILNEKGRAMLSLAIENLERATELEQTFGKQSANSAGQLKIGASTTIGNYFIPKVLGSFMKEFPGIQLSLQIENSESIVESILNYESDLGFIEGHSLNSQLECLKWRRDRLLIVCSPKHELADKDKLTKRDLGKIAWVLREQGSGSRQVFEEAIKDHTDQLQVLLELGNTEAIKHTVASGLGVGCVSFASVRDQLRKGELIALRAPMLDLNRYFYMVYRKDKYHNATFSRVVEYWKRLSLNL